MKYKIKSRRTVKKAQRQNRPLFAKRRKAREKIDFNTLFEISTLPDIAPKIPIKKQRHKAFFFRIKRCFVKIASTIKGMAAKLGKSIKKAYFSAAATLRRRAEMRRKRPNKLYFLTGALCAALCVGVLSAAIVSFSLFSSYGGSYKTVTVPNLVGEEYNGEDGDGLFSYVVDYEYNPTVEAGHIISQAPAPNTKRRVYGAKGQCVISLTVSHARPTYTLPDLIGKSERDSVLELRNNGIVPKIKTEYSNTVSADKIIRTSHTAGTVLKYGDTVTLTVSLGKQKIYSAVPRLTGLSEMAAVSRIKSAGLTLGVISYEHSDVSAGTVIAQSIEAGSSAEEGTAVDLTVSSGAHSLKKIPSLYGLTVEEAIQALRDYGLTVGNIIKIKSAEASGTVIFQTPSANTAITSSTVSVDIYVSE